MMTNQILKLQFQMHFLSVRLVKFSTVRVTMESAWIRIDAV